MKFIIYRQQEVEENLVQIHGNNICEGQHVQSIILKSYHWHRESNLNKKNVFFSLCMNYRLNGTVNQTNKIFIFLSIFIIIIVIENDSKYFIINNTFNITLCRYETFHFESNRITNI